MEIALIADDNKKELMAQFCIAYCGILSRHHICATHTTGRYISDATGLELENDMPGYGGGLEQINSRISYKEIGSLPPLRRKQHPPGNQHCYGRGACYRP